MIGQDPTDFGSGTPRYEGGAAPARAGCRQVGYPEVGQRAERVVLGHEQEALRMREWYRAGIDRAYVEMMVPLPSGRSVSPGASPPAGWPETALPGAVITAADEVRTWYRTWYETEAQPGAAMEESWRAARGTGLVRLEAPAMPIPAVEAAPTREHPMSPPPASFLRRGGPAPISGGRARPRPAGAR